MDYVKELNPAQLEAVQSMEGPYLVIAGAGSGKTRTLVYRVAYLVEKGIQPDQILLLTFTRKAAEEMLRRSAGLLDERCRKVSGGTFHSFANTVLRRYAPYFGLPRNFTIMDESDSENAVNNVRAQLGFNNAEKRFPRKGAILDVISKSVNKNEDIGIVLSREYPHFAAFEMTIRKIRDEYARYKFSRSLMDYDDLLVFLDRLLKENDDARVELSDRFKHIMIDEYQDTNLLQADISRLLASEHGNIMAVGDDSQSIYSFRGADFQNIMNFPRIFKGTKIIILEENYRSTQPILNMTNEVIRFAEVKFEKKLYTKKRLGTSPVFIDAYDEHSQSMFISGKIRELTEGGVELRDIAVLFRAAWHSNDLEIELSNRNIPFLKYGGQRFVEAAHIKDVISCLRIAHNPSDYISWQRALMLMRGVGPKTAEKIIKGIRTADRDFEIADDAAVKKTSDLKKFIVLLKQVRAEEESPLDILKRFIEYYEPLLALRYDDFHKRAPDLNSLARIAARYSSLEQFLSDMALEPPEKEFISPKGKTNGKDALTLSTIHSAKGLEWHSVFVIYLAEGYFPSYQSLDTREAIEEERRLFYVAATRAKENLFLLRPKIDRSSRSFFKKNSAVFTEVSRFLREGGILEKFVDCQSLGGDGFLEGVEFEDVFEL